MAKYKYFRLETKQLHCCGVKVARGGKKNGQGCVPIKTNIWKQVAVSGLQSAYFSSKWYCHHSESC